MPGDYPGDLCVEGYDVDFFLGVLRFHVSGNTQVTLVLAYLFFGNEGCEIFLVLSSDEGVENLVLVFLQEFVLVAHPFEQLGTVDAQH